ncbi:MAG TPA: thiol-activated cytolysin family protein [Candidatus Deferrimicrobium sp.]|nr:thiol-activated cytolysin family protein [Candidatus Deferrimicrobium sp.]
MKTKHSWLWWVVPVCVLPSLIFWCAGCSDKKSPTSPVPADVDAYLATLPTWEEFADVQDTATQPAGDKVAEMSSQVLCTTTPYNITQNPDQIVTFGSAPDVLYLGSLIQGDSYLGGLGTMEELPIRQRAPLTIAIKLFTGTDITSVVQNPDAASVQAALNTLVADAAANGQQSGSRISYNYKESFSAMQAALSLGVSFKYMTSAGQAALDFQMSESSHTITALFKQIMFEAYIVRPQTPGQFFSANFTQERLDEQITLGNIGPNNLPVYVSRIQYGRMLLYSMTSSSSSSLLKAAVSASYNGVASVDANIRTEVQNILQNADIKVATIGGDPQGVMSLLRSGQLKDYFTTDDPITTAEPLAYALCNLADGSLAQVSEMTSYSIKECSEVGVLCFTNKTEWQMKVAELVGEGHIVEFLTTADNIAKSVEFPSLPGSNVNLGHMLTWDSSSTHFPFTFYLKALSSGYRLVWDDLESNSPAFAPLDQERSISIGEVNDEENDDFEIAIPTWNNQAAVFAIGITVSDNSKESGEGAKVYGVNGFANEDIPNSVPNSPGMHGFLGVVATVPLISLKFNESDTGDDIFVRDFCFGVLEWTE